MSPAAPEDDGPHSRKRSRDGDERPPREKERTRDGDERPPREKERTRDGDERPLREKERTRDGDERPLREKERTRGGDERPRERERPRRDEKERPPPETDARPPRSRRDAERDSRRRGEKESDGGRRRGERESDEGRHRVERAEDSSRHRRTWFRDSLDVPPPDGKVAAKDEEGGRGNDGGDVPQRSRSFFQHDERDSAAYGGRPMVHRNTERGRWGGPKEQFDDRLGDHRFSRDDPSKKDDGPQSNKRDDDSAWKHDGFYELEAGAPPPRKRPAFSEKKPEGHEPSVGISVGIPPPLHEKSVINLEPQEDGEGHNPHGSDRYERSYGGGGGRDFRRAEGGPPRYGPQFRDRFGGMSGARGRDRFVGRKFEGRGFQQPAGFIQVEKWKHDLYEEANRSPSPKNDEDKLAKLEALLAS